MCDKTSFDTKADAKKRLKEIKLTSDRAKKPIRAYLCDICSKYHLTSFTVKAQKDVEYKRTPEFRQMVSVSKAASYWIEKKGWKLD